MLEDDLQLLVVFFYFVSQLFIRGEQLAQTRKSTDNIRCPLAPLAHC